MTAALATACGVLGVALGPLLNVVIDRVPRKEPVWPDGLRLPGRARPSSAREALVDLAAGALFAAAAVRFAGHWVLPAYLVFFTAILVVSVIDLEHYLIPNRIVYPTLAASLPLLVLAAAADDRWMSLRDALVGAVLSWSLLLVVHLVSPRGMGFGDVRLAFVLGLFLGWLGLDHVLLGLFAGFFFGAVAGVVLVAVRRRSRKDAIPFGPFLALGALVAVLAGVPLLDWYQGG